MRRPSSSSSQTWRVQGEWRQQAGVSTARTTPGPAGWDYGPLPVAKGEHRGKIGYYDGNDDEPGYAIMYLGEPFVSDYAVIPQADWHDRRPKMRGTPR